MFTRWLFYHAKQNTPTPFLGAGVMTLAIYSAMYCAAIYASFFSCSAAMFFNVFMSSSIVCILAAS